MPASVLHSRRGALALAIASGAVVFALGPLAFGDAPTRMDVRPLLRTLEPLRPRLRAGDRVALLPGSDPLRRTLTQYALAPAYVIPLGPERWTTNASTGRIDDATHLLAYGARLEDVLTFGARLGFRLDAAPPGVVLMARERR